MTKPPAITLFERLFLASIGVGLAASVLTWSFRAELLDRNPVLGNGTIVILISTIFSLALNVFLWWLVTRRASAVGKWAVVVLSVLAAVVAALAVPGLAGGPIPVHVVAIGIASNLLYVAAALMLFRADARDWFGETDREPVA